MRSLVGAWAVILLLVTSSRSWAAGPSKQECVAANDSGQSLRRAERLREARAALAVCVATSCPGPVREDCAQRLSELDAVMPSLVFEVRDGSGGDLSAVHVTMDGRLLASTLDGSALIVDPGEHQFAFDDGTTHVDQTLVVHEGDRDRHVRVTLNSAVPGGESAAAVGAPVPAIVAFGVGGAGLIVGTVFAAEGASAKSSANAACGPAGNQCPGDAGSRNSTIRTDTAVAVAGFGVAAAGAAVGALLLLPHAQQQRASQGRQVRPILGVGYVGLSGSF